jgi:hypothetical protein
MGFLNSLKNKAAKAAEALAQAQLEPSEANDGGQTASPPSADVELTQAVAAAPPADGPSFSFNGDTYPLPPGWDGLSIEDWFFKLESLRDRMMNIDDETLPPMTDEDGDELDPEEVLLLQEGFQSGGHYENFRNWGVAGWAAQTGESPTDCEFRMGGIARERITAGKAEAMSGAGGALEPVDGVSVEQWAQIQAQIAGGGDVDTLIAAAGIDAGTWEHVSAEWMARMSTDTTHTVSTVYSNAFAGGGQFGAQAANAASVGVGGDLSAEPIPFETYVEVMEAQSAASDRGEDVNAVLGSFGLSILDWSNIGMYWSKRQQQEATKYYELFNEYSAKYSAKYR